MTLMHEQLSPQTEQVLDRYDALYGDQQGLVIGPDDFRVPPAMAIERFNMLLLGDTEEMVDRDIPKDLEQARFLTIYPKNEEPGIDNMLGVVRVTDAHPLTGTLKSFREAAEVTGEDYQTIFAHFVAQTGQSDPFKVFDINTYGMAPSVWEAEAAGNKELYQATKYNLMYAMTREGIRMHEAAGVTHGIAYFNAFSLGYFRNKGYDWQRLNGYEPVHDSFVDENGELKQGQALLPTVLDIEQHIVRMRSGATQHLGELAAHILKRPNAA